MESEKKEFIENNKIENVTVVDKTPMGDEIYAVEFEGGKTLNFTKRKFDCVARSAEGKLDPTKTREELVTEVGKVLYGIMVEYGLTFSEIDPVLNEVVRLANDGQNLANDYLWGNKAYERTLIDVNKVLLQNDQERIAKEEAASEEGYDGPASVGGTDDTETKD